MASPHTAAHMLDISRTTLYQLMRDGTLQYGRIGRNRRLLVSDIESYARTLIAHAD